MTRAHVFITDESMRRELLAANGELIKQRDELRGKLADCALSDVTHCQEIIEQGEEIITLRQQRDAAVAALRLSVQFVAKWTADHESVIGQRALTRIEAALELCKEGE